MYKLPEVPCRILKVLSSVWSSSRPSLSLHPQISPQPQQEDLLSLHISLGLHPTRPGASPLPCSCTTGFLGGSQDQAPRSPPHTPSALWLLSRKASLDDFHPEKPSFSPCTQQASGTGPNSVAVGSPVDKSMEKFPLEAMPVAAWLTALPQPAGAGPFALLWEESCPVTKPPVNLFLASRPGTATSEVTSWFDLVAPLMATCGVWASG